MNFNVVDKPILRAMSVERNEKMLFAMEFVWFDSFGNGYVIKNSSCTFPFHLFAVAHSNSKPISTDKHMPKMIYIAMAQSKNFLVIQSSSKSFALVAECWKKKGFKSDAFHLLSIT